MRTLRFIIDGQIIKPDPSCDFSNIVPGTHGYLQAEFIFSDDWNGFAKVAGFWSALGDELEPSLIYDGKHCKIPDQAADRKTFLIQVIGMKRDVLLKTNKVVVLQDGGSE